MRCVGCMLQARAGGRTTVVRALSVTAVLEVVVVVKQRRAERSPRPLGGMFTYYNKGGHGTQKTRFKFIVAGHGRSKDAFLFCARATTMHLPYAVLPRVNPCCSAPESRASCFDLAARLSVAAQVWRTSPPPSTRTRSRLLYTRYHQLWRHATHPEHVFCIPRPFIQTQHARTHPHHVPAVAPTSLTEQDKYDRSIRPRVQGRGRGMEKGLVHSLGGSMKLRAPRAVMSNERLSRWAMQHSSLK